MKTEPNECDITHFKMTCFQFQQKRWTIDYTSIEVSDWPVYHMDNLHYIKIYVYKKILKIWFVIQTNLIME